MKKSRIETELSKEQFKEFYTYLNLIKDDFRDLCIVNGQFRGRTNNHTAIFEAFFEYFKDMNFIIGNIRSLVIKISVLSKKTKISVIVDDENIYFADGYQNIKIGRAPEEYCDNPFVSENELNKIILKNNDSNKPLIKYSLPKALVSNFKRMADEINVETIKFMHSENDLCKGRIAISSDDACEYSYDLSEDLLTSMDKGHYFKFSTLPLIFNKFDLILDFILSSDQSIMINVYHTKIDKLSINIYCRTQYLGPDDK